MSSFFCSGIRNLIMPVIENSFVRQQQWNLSQTLEKLHQITQLKVHHVCIMATFVRCRLYLPATATYVLCQNNVFSSNCYVTVTYVSCQNNVFTRNCYVYIMWKIMYLPAAFTYISCKNNIFISNCYIWFKITLSLSAVLWC